MTILSKLFGTKKSSEPAKKFIKLEEYASPDDRNVFFQFCCNEFAQGEFLAYYCIEEFKKTFNTGDLKVALKQARYIIDYIWTPAYKETLSKTLQQKYYKNEDPGALGTVNISGKLVPTMLNPKTLFGFKGDMFKELQSCVAYTLCDAASRYLAQKGPVKLGEKGIKSVQLIKLDLVQGCFDTYSLGVW